MAAGGLRADRPAPGLCKPLPAHGLRADRPAPGLCKPLLSPLTGLRLHACRDREREREREREKERERER